MFNPAVQQNKLEYDGTTQEYLRRIKTVYDTYLHLVDREFFHWIPAQIFSVQFTFSRNSATYKYIFITSLQLLF
jgi:hypothetical protein